jgi:hypothetical protein
MIPSWNLNRDGNGMIGNVGQLAAMPFSTAEWTLVLYRVKRSNVDAIIGAIKSQPGWRLVSAGTASPWQTTIKLWHRNGVDSNGIQSTAIANSITGVRYQQERRVPIDGAFRQVLSCTLSKRDAFRFVNMLPMDVKAYSWNNDKEVKAQRYCWNCCSTTHNSNMCPSDTKAACRICRSKEHLQKDCPLEMDLDAHHCHVCSDRKTANINGEGDHIHPHDHVTIECPFLRRFTLIKRKPQQLPTVNKGPTPANPRPTPTSWAQQVHNTRAPFVSTTTRSYAGAVEGRSSNNSNSSNGRGETKAHTPTAAPNDQHEITAQLRAMAEQVRSMAEQIKTMAEQIKLLTEKVAGIEKREKVQDSLLDIAFKTIIEIKQTKEGSNANVRGANDHVPNDSKSANDGASGVSNSDNCYAASHEVLRVEDEVATAAAARKKILGNGNRTHQTTLEGSEVAGSRQQATSSRQQAAGNKQQAADSKQQATGSKQQAASSKHKNKSVVSTGKSN